MKVRTAAIPNCIRTVIALLAVLGGLCADDSVTVTLPQSVKFAPSTQPNLLADGGFENVKLDASVEPTAWRTISHTYTTDKALGREVDEKLKQHRTAEIRTGDAAEGRAFAYLRNPDEADAWRGGVKGPDFASYLTRFVRIPGPHELKHAVLTMCYKARLSPTASTSYVRMTLSCVDNAEKPWSGKATRDWKMRILTDSDAWRAAKLEMLVPPETRALQVSLYLDGCGEAMFDDVQLRLEEPPAGPEMRLWPMSALGNELHIAGGFGLLNFVFRNQRGETPKNLMAVLDLPDGFDLVNTRFGIAATERHAAHAIHRIPVSALRDVMRANRERWETTQTLSCAVKTSLAPSAKTFTARYWLEGEGYRSESQSFTLRVVGRVRVAHKPQLFRSGAVLGREFEFDHTDEAASRAAIAGVTKLYTDTGFNAIHAPARDAVLMTTLGAAGIHRSFEALWIVNGYHLGPAKKPDFARMVLPDGSFHADGICPMEVIERGPFFRESIEAPLRKILVTDRTSDGVMPNWEPGAYQDNKGCYCARCQRAFIAHSKLPADEVKAAWPRDIFTRYHEAWVKFRSWQHSRVCVTLERTVNALGKEAGIDAHFAPSIGHTSLIAGDYHEKHFGEIDPYDYATELPWLEPWGPYVRTELLHPEPAAIGRNIHPFIAGRDIMATLTRRIPDGAKRPKLIAYPHGFQLEDWVATPQAIAMDTLSFFVNRWRGSYVYFFPRGYDARYWNALAAANDLIGRHEDIVLNGRPTDQQRVTALTPLPAHAGFNNVMRGVLQHTYPDAITAPLLQTRGFVKGNTRLIAVGNFCETQSCPAKLAVMGLAATKRYVINGATSTGAELAQGVAIEAPALRWTFIVIEPVP